MVLLPPESDYYQILGVGYDDPPAKIKARFRLLALTMHPDLPSHPSPEAFSRIVKAYRVLKEGQARARYNAEIGLQVKPRRLRAGYDLYQRMRLDRAHGLQGGAYPLKFRRDEPCPLCWGSGCFRCNGYGQVTTQVEASVWVPRNTVTARTLLVAGEGGQSEPGGSRGNLVVYVSLE
jgi:DnaJ-class molecular chaperone